MKQVTARDAAYLYLGDGVATATVVSCQVVVNPAGRPLELTEDRLLEWISERIWISDLFTSKLIRLPSDIGYPYWVPDPDFSAAAHLQVHRNVGTWASAIELVERFGDSPMDLAHAPWLMHVIPDVTGVPGHAGLCSLVVFRFHHIAFDGVTSATLGEKVFDDGVVSEATRAEGRVVGKGTASRAALTRRELRRGPALWSRFAQEGIGIVRASRQQRRAQAGGGRPHRVWPVTRFNHDFRGPRTVGHILFDRGDVLEMKSSLGGATVNDLMLSIVGQAVHDYLGRRNETPPSSLSALVPVSTRGMREADAANQFVPVVVDLVTTETDPRVRISLIAAETARKKNRVKQKLAEQTTGFIDIVPAPVLRLLGAGRPRRKKSVAPPRFNVVITNLPGIARHGSFCGMNIVDSFTMQPVGSGATLAHAISDRGDHIAMSITVDSAVMPDIGEYCQIVRESFETHRATII
ncbi:WS/DGAT/MGAT family acyltransferase [Williamsia muralis]|uniref:diacylglycerol O-acyltransferase n=1 Tax=Williamsia marianensis TaxID=85044 RepID=A0A495JZL6_WILMA|nr:WS/DGAT domain-containing protein [Williamsia muralis]RKR94416.1 WS/DGAT/MGAT family acyltransferase [Williamsia muralis]